MTALGGGLSCPPSRLAEISIRPYTAVNAPSTLESHLQGASNARPISVHAGYSNGNSRTTVSLVDPLEPPVYFDRPSSTTSETLHNTSNASISQSRDHSTSNIKETKRDSSELAETATICSNHLAAAEPMLPPRRELPFLPRSSLPRSVGSDSARPPSRPLTGSMGPPLLPARVASLRPSSSLGLSYEAELHPLARPSVLAQSTSGASAMHQLPQMSNQDHCILLTPGSPFSQGDNQRLSSSSPATSPLLFKRANTTAVPSLPPLGTPRSATQKLRWTIPQTIPAAPPTSEATCRDPTVPGVVSELRMDRNDRLKAYIAQPKEERRAALNEFIFRHLESDDFLTLVEDMETCWVKVALGIK